MSENNDFLSLSKNSLQLLVNDQMESFLQQDIGVEREVLSNFSKHKDNPYAVVISGLRRVGKSTLLLQIARKLYQERNYYYINFEDERLLHFKTEHFQTLLEVFMESFGERKVMFMDEIQNIEGWERFVRRLVDEGYKVYLTGSNASLLSSELGTKLTGRYISVELFPFSFYEFLQCKEVSIPDFSRLTTKSKNVLKRLLNLYIKTGGIPMAVKYPSAGWHKTLYEDILYRDVATRYHINEVKALKELSFYLISNLGTFISFNKLKELLKLGSVNTVKDYIEYLGLSWLFFLVNRYAFSLKTQSIANKKIYAIDTGLVKSIGFSFSENQGRMLENLVFLALRKKKEPVFYYKTKSDAEIDFYLPKQKTFVQVSQSIADPKTREREIQTLLEALGEIKGSRGFIVTEDEKEILSIDGIVIPVVPVYEWLLSEVLLTRKR